MNENHNTPACAEGRAAQIEATRNFLCSYQYALDVLNLRAYERKRARKFDEPYDVPDLVTGNESFWKNRMYEVETFIENMRTGRERLLLYYHYIRGESIEHLANLLGISRRSAYRLHAKGLLNASFLYERFFS